MWVNTQSHFIAAEGSVDYCCQTLTRGKFTFRVSLSHFSLPPWITKHHLSLQVLPERIRINYYSSVLSMVTAPVSSSVYFVTTFSDLLSNDFFLVLPRKQAFSVASWWENKSLIPFLSSSKFAILISLTMKFYPYITGQSGITYIYLRLLKR